MTGCLIFVNTGCGLLGTASPPTSQTNSAGATGCLDNSKNLVTRYVNGQMDSTSWKSSFTCINTSLEFFTNYVKGSSADAYTPDDMFNLVTHFLITSSPINRDLLVSAFSLKSALFGGNSQEFTKEEITILKSTLTRLGDITGALIPYLEIRQQANPSYDQLLEMVTAFKQAGDQLSDLVNTLPVGMMSDEAMNTLINQLSITLNLPTINDSGKEVFLVKWLLFNTRRDALETADWAQILKTTLGTAGIVLAYQSSVGDDLTAPKHDLSTRFQNDYLFREFILNLAVQFRPYLENAISNHHGVIPFPVFEHVIDSLPDTFLPAYPRPILKDAFRSVFKRIFASQTKEGMDLSVTNTFYNFLTETVKDLGALDRFYAATGLDTESVPTLTLSQKMSDYANTLSPTDQARFLNVKSKVLNYQPSFHKTLRNDGLNGAPKEHQTILYSTKVGYSRFQNFLVIGVDHAARLIQKAYGSVNNGFTNDDFTEFFKEYTPILFAANIVDPTVPKFGPNRIRDMDLFTPIGDGSGQGSIEELVSYAMTIISAADLTERMRTEITPICDAHIGQDIMGWTYLDPDCFRHEFGQRLSYWLDDFPRLKTYWDKKLTTAEQAKAMRWLEHGARRDGFNQEPLGKFDINAMATILHYTESMFDRFDFDQNEMLSRSEINSAYPIFKNKIYTLAQEKSSFIKGDWLLEGVFTYIVRYQELPDLLRITSMQGLKEDLKVGAWILTYLVQPYTTDRSGVFNIVCQLGAPENPNLALTHAVACAP